MSALLGGIRERRFSAAVLLASGCAVTAGCLAAVSFSSLTGRPLGAAGVLVVLGMVALAVHAASAAQERRAELALASLRGRPASGVLTYFVTEPLVLLAAGTGLGVLLGRRVLQEAARRWLPDGTSVHVPVIAWICVAVTAGAALAAVLAGSWRVLRAPLVEQLDTAARPRPATAPVLVGQVLLVVAAVVATAEATRSAPVRTGWAGLLTPALLSPVLLGLLAGSVVTVVLRGLARRATSALAPRSLPRFLAVRRLGRRTGSVSGARLVIAAGVVLAVTANAVAAVGDWRDTSVRLTLGGPTRYAVPAGALAAYSASHRADPDGRWLMAVVSAADPSEAYRRAFVDSARWAAVAGDFYRRTDAASLGRAVAALDVGQQVRPLTGRALTVDFDRASLATTSELTVTATYVDDAGRLQNAVLTAPASRGAGPVRVATPISGCVRACVVHRLLVDSIPRAGRRAVVVLDTVRVGSTDVLALDRWSVAFSGGLSLPVSVAGGGVRLPPSRYPGIVELVPDTARQRLAAVTTPGLHLQSAGKRGAAFGVDGSKHSVEVVATVPSLPLLGRAGAVLDLSRALAFAGSTIPTARAYVVARGDTPESVIDALEGTGSVGQQQTFDAELQAAERGDSSQGAHLYVLLSWFAAMLAAVGLVAAVGSSRTDRRREAASLRAAGVPADVVRAAYACEAAWLGVAVAVAVGVTGWIAARVTVNGLALVPRTPYAPLLSPEPHLGQLFVVAAAAGGVTAIVTLLGTRRVAHRSPPRLLRDDGGA